MLVVEAPICHPGCCFICRSTPKGIYVDTGMDSWGSGGDERIYVCKDCAEELGHLVGCLSAKKSDEIVHRSRVTAGKLGLSISRLKKLQELDEMVESLVEARILEKMVEHNPPIPDKGKECNFVGELLEDVD